MEYYVDAIQDLNLYCLSYLKAHQIFDATSKANEIFNKILQEELNNELPIDIKERAEKSFLENYKKSIGKPILEIYHLMIVHCLYIIGRQLQMN